LAQAASCCSSGSCEGESIAKRQEVCLAVIDHLRSGQLTGKAELDAFVDVQQSLQIPQEWFASWITGLAAQRTLPRYATAKRVNDIAAQSAGSLSLMTARALSDGAGEFAPVVHAQLTAWGAALRWCGLLHDVKSHVMQGRYMLPLDDLIRHQLTEKDLKRFAEEGTTKGDERWRALVNFETDRIRSLLRGGGKAMGSLADEGCRRTFAAAGVFALKRLERLLAKGGDPFATTVRLTTLQRVTAMPRVVKFVWDCAEKRPSRDA
jgi:phytoene/squalene synthetase